MMKSKGYAKGGARGGAMKSKGMAKGGAVGGVRKKAYAKGGKVAAYNLGGMVKSMVAPLKTGIRYKGAAVGGVR